MNLLLKLTELDFYAIDLQLYIDTHPDDKQAIAEYNRTIYEAKKIREEYEKKRGPLYSFQSQSDSGRFTWIDEPWPWETEFNN